MNIFLTILFKIIPLYILILLGFITGKYLKINKEYIARLLIYIIAPVVVFNSVINTPLTANILALPVLFFSLSCIICLSTYHLARYFWSDETRNILAFTSGTGNTGYFGLPVALAIFGPKASNAVIISILGFILYENSLGFYITARGHNKVKQSIFRVLTLPTLYAFMIALILNSLKINLGINDSNFTSLFKDVYTVLGMMLIGLGIATIKSFKFDFKFVGATFLIKFVIWPTIILLIIFADVTYFRFFNSEIHKVMLLMSIVPLAANTVAFATELNTHLDKASFAVLASTIFALFYVPFVTSLLIK